MQESEFFWVRIGLLSICLLVGYIVFPYVLSIQGVSSVRDEITISLRICYSVASMMMFRLYMHLSFSHPEMYSLVGTLQKAY